VQFAFAATYTRPWPWEAVSVDGATATTTASASSAWEKDENEQRLFNEFALCCVGLRKKIPWAQMYLLNIDRNVSQTHKKDQTRNDDMIGRSFSAGFCPTSALSIFVLRRVESQNGGGLNPLRSKEITKRKNTKKQKTAHST
jgi:hypothetical protein